MSNSQVLRKLCALKISTGAKMGGYGIHNESTEKSCYLMRDLDFDPVTLMCECSLDTMVTYLYAKNKVSRSMGSKVMVQIHRQTGMCETFIYPLSWTITNCIFQ